ncbi:MAG: 2'-5' RNA ligase family protein [Propionibacteriaceae bacterium]|nr:2'-5' RNA ligase family protein [Propionibacteriaceae bacterium]
MDDVRYGLYLRPSAAMCRAQAEVHALLARQYNLHVAGRFMPHATIKGFFRSDAPVAEIVEHLDRAMRSRSPVNLTNRGPIAFGGTSIVLDVHHDVSGEINGALQALHEAAIEQLLPLVHLACNFTPNEWLGPMFFAHLTLAMADLDERFAEEVMAFVGDLGPIGPSQFLADTFQLFAFRSNHWTGEWWHDFGWTMLHSWRLS